MTKKRGTAVLHTTKPTTLRLTVETLDMLQAVAGRAKSQYADAVLNDALKRGIVVTVGGTIIQPGDGDLFAGKRRPSK